MIRPALIAALFALPTVVTPLRASHDEGARLDHQIETDGSSSGSSGRDDDLAVTHHEVTIGGEAVAYTATAGALPLKGDDGKVRANVFFVAYTRDGAEDSGRRPL